MANDESYVGGSVMEDSRNKKEGIYFSFNE